MKRKELDRIVGQDLDHIPIGAKGSSSQNELRMIYNLIRRRDLGRNASANRGDSFRRAVEAVRAQKPEFIPEYDAGYFAQ